MMQTYFISDGTTFWRVAAKTPDIAVVVTYFDTRSVKPRWFIHHAPLISKFEDMKHGTKSFMCMNAEFTSFVSKNYPDVMEALHQFCEIKPECSFERGKLVVDEFKYDIIQQLSPKFETK